MEGVAAVKIENRVGAVIGNKNPLLEKQKEGEPIGPCHCCTGNVFSVSLFL
jgi:hypothetical protein